MTKVGNTLWPPETAVKLDLAGGADIPAFSATFTMPPAPTLTSPQVAADGSSTIDHGGAVVVR